MADYLDPPDPKAHGCRLISTDVHEAPDKLYGSLDITERLGAYFSKRGFGGPQLARLDPKYPEGEYPDWLDTIERDKASVFEGWYACPIGAVVHIGG